MAVVDRSTDFRGRYHVLGGRLSPLDGIGPGVAPAGPPGARGCGTGGVREVILATNPSMEGEVTATYIQQLLAGHGRAGHPARARAAHGRRSRVRRRRDPGARAGRAAGRCPDAVARGALRRRARGRARSAGWMLAQRRLATHQRDLFSPRPLRRLAALGYLAGQTGVETVRLLRDYLAWERQPVLRRRAEAILRRTGGHPGMRLVR